MWDLPGPGLEPLSLALAGGFLTTAPPGKLPPPSFGDLNYTYIRSLEVVQQITALFVFFQSFPLSLSSWIVSVAMS